MGQQKRERELRWAPKKQSAIRMNKEAWEDLQWLSKRLGVKASETTRRAVRMLVAIEKERHKRGEEPLTAPPPRLSERQQAANRAVTKAYEFLFGNHSKG